jgi:hypothetical protein
VSGFGAICGEIVMKAMLEEFIQAFPISVGGNG